MFHEINESQCEIQISDLISDIQIRKNSNRNSDRILI